MYRTLLSALLAAPLLLAGCDRGEDFRLQPTRDQVIRPAHERWHDANLRAVSELTAFCAGDRTLAQARQAFGAMQHSWAALQPVMIGPINDGNRAWQVQFYPDKRNMVMRQVETLLNDTPDLDAARLADASVVVQGLTALEYALFDAALDWAQPQIPRRYCPLVTAISQHQARLSGEVLSAWQDPGPAFTLLTRFPNDLYADSDAALADLLRVQVTALDTLKRKLGVPIGRQNQNLPQPLQAEAWRSEASLANLGATVGQARQHWQVTFRPAAPADLADRIDSAFTEVEERLQAMPLSLEAQLREASRHLTDLNELYAALDRVHRLHQNELAPALNVRIGFNANDGD